MSSGSNQRTLSTLKVWRYPALLGLLTFTGLLIALIRDDIPWRPLAWIALSVPLAVIGYKSVHFRK